MKSNLNPEYSKAARKIIGRHFAEVRREKGMTQQQLADKMGIGVKTVGKIENGAWNYSLDFLFSFCIHLDLYLFLPEKSSNDDMAEMMRNRHNRPGDKN